MSAKTYQSKWRVQQGDQKRKTDPNPDRFIVATGQDNLKPDAKALKIIRHHAMKGKNRKRLLKVNSSCAVRAEHRITVHDVMAEPATFPIHKLGFRTGFIAPGMLDIVCKFISNMKKGMYPLNDFVDLDKDEECWLWDMSCDPLYNNTVQHIARIYYDTMASHSHTLTAITHVNTAMAELRFRLARPGLVITDSVMLTVLSLALISDVIGDLEAARKHLTGLCQLIKLRGGLPTLTEKHSLRIKCCRLDLRLALGAGAKPIFLSEHEISWKPNLAQHPQRSSNTPVHIASGAPDVRLVNAWFDLQDFTIAINRTQHSRQKMASRLFQEILVSLQYRLQNLAYEGHDPQEVLRLAMLAFTTTLFLKTNDILVQCRPLALQLKSGLLCLGSSGEEQLLQLHVWAIFIGRVSVLGSLEERLWLEDQFHKPRRVLGLTSWTKTRELLKTFAWVDSIHDSIGEELFSGFFQT